MHFEMRCSSSGFHVYRSIWKPRIEENLQMKPEYANVHDPLTTTITAYINVLNYGGLLEGRVKDVRYRRSPIQKGGLEIPVMMEVKRHRASSAIFNKMKVLVLKYYTEPENIKKYKVQSEMEKPSAIDDFEEFGPTDDVEASQQTDADVDVLEDVICKD